MKVQHFSFGQIQIDDIEYSYDVVIDRGKVAKRKKKSSKKFREAFGHTPLLSKRRFLGNATDLWWGPAQVRCLSWTK